MSVSLPTLRFGWPASMLLVVGVALSPDGGARSIGGHGSPLAEERGDSRAVEGAEPNRALEWQQEPAADGPGERKYDSKPLLSRSDRRKAAKKTGGSSVLDAVDEALEWLVEHQSEDGSWGPENFVEHCDVKKDKDKCDGIGSGPNVVGVTGLALLALIQDGNSTHAGPYAEEVHRGIAWLVKGQAKSGDLGGGATHYSNYSHAIATLALAKLVAAGDDEWMPALEKATTFVLDARNPGGAWRYEFPPSGDNDTSVTGWMVEALVAARKAGVQIEAELFDEAKRGALAFIDSARENKTGRIGYTDAGSFSARIPGINDDYPQTAGEPLTAIGLCVWLALDRENRNKVVLEMTAKLLLKTPPIGEEKLVDHYYWYHGTRAMYRLGGQWWKEWSRPLRDLALDEQCTRKEGHRRGSWDPVGAWGYAGGRVYSTALLTLALQVFYAED